MSTVYSRLQTSKENREFVAEILNTIANFLSEEPLRDELLMMDTHKHIIDCLLSEDSTLRSATVNMMFSCCKYPDLSDMFIDKKVLDW